MELTEDGNNPAENHQDNGTSPLHGTHPYLLHSPLTDALVTTEKPPPLPHIKGSGATRLVSRSYIPEACPKGAVDALYGVYQDWVNQNTGNHLDGGIK